MKSLTTFAIGSVVLWAVSASAAAGNCKAGGAGTALAFDGLDGTTVSMKWDAPPTQTLTIEYWVNVIDPHLTQQPVFAYSAYNVAGRDGAGGAPYENANELVLLHAPTYFRLFRATSNKNLGSSGLYDAAYNWTHVAVVWAADPASSPHGQLAYYLNGVLVDNVTACAYQACDFGMGLQAGGVIHLGQEADKPWGDFEELQALTAIVDELRVWSTVRTDAQILASFASGIDTATDPDAGDLAFYWRFDTAGLTQGSSAVDSSGKGLTGLVGAMATTENQLQYSTGRASQTPAAPVQLPSTAGLVGEGPVVVPVVAGSNLVVLSSSDPDGDDLATYIRSAPTSGTLSNLAGVALGVGDVVVDGGRTAGKRVYYTPSTTPGASFADSFTFGVSDGGAEVQASVSLVPYSMPVPAAKSYTFDEDALSYMVLGKPYIGSASKETVMLQVVITSLPARGTLYQACFEQGGDGTYSNVCAAGTSTPLTPITAAGTLLTNARGILMYQPEANEFNASYASFSYKFRDPDAGAALESAEALVTIAVASVNDAPQGVAQSSAGVVSAATTFTLSSTDADENATDTHAYDPSFAPHAFAKISSFPRGGKLYQVQADGTAGDMLDATVTNVPIVSDWVSEIVRFSSQFSKCNAGACFIWSGAEDTGCQQSNTKATSTCTGSDCAVAYGEPLVWGGGTCSETAWQANQFVGAADFYPGYGDTALGWDLSAENSGKEFIEVRFPNKVYVTAFELYETYKPGAVFEVSSAPEYTDDNTVACCGPDFPAGGNCDGRPTCSKNTAWRTLWSGTAGNSGDVANVFAPPLCPYAYQTDVIRLDLDTAAAAGWNNFDAAKLYGSLEFPPGLILPDATDAGAENKVIYAPLSGVHGTDSFEYAVTDCLGYGPPSTISTTLATPSAAFEVLPYLSVSAIMAEGGSTTLAADLTSPLEPGTYSLHALVKGFAPPGENLTITLKGLQGVPSLTFGGATLSAVGDVLTLDPSEWQSAPTIVLAAGSGHAELWLDNGGSLTYRMQVHVCPKYEMALLSSGQMAACTACKMPDAASAAYALDAATYASVCAADPTPCAAGFFANASAEGGCSKCPLDTYKTEAGDAAALCLPCPNSTFTASTGSDLATKCLPLPVEEMSYLPDSLLSIGYLLFAFNWFAALFFASWVYAYRKARIIRLAQPEFLYLICLGCMVSTSTIVVLGYDDGNASADSADAACALLPWLYSGGFCLTFAALFAKIERVKRIFLNQQMKNVSVKVRDMAKPMLALLGVDTAILAAWTGSDPLKFVRSRGEDDYDTYGNPVRSQGTCTSPTSWYFLAPLVVLHVLVLIYGNRNAYLTRSVSSEFQESKYVAISMASTLQVMVLGLPILVMVADNPMTNYFVRVGIIFLNDAGVLLLIFVPKMRSFYTMGKVAVMEGTMGATAATATSASCDSGPAGAPGDVNEELQQENTELKERVYRLTEQIEELKGAMPLLEKCSGSAATGEAAATASPLAAGATSEEGRHMRVVP